jgi:ribosomal protein L11 methyltransferase
MHKKCQHPLNKFPPEVPDVKQVSSCVPYQNLYIYYIEGPLSREEEPLLGPYFLGNWIEEGSSFLFFSRPAKGFVQGIVDNEKGLRLIDEFRFTYEEWQGGKVEPLKVSRFLILPPWEDDQEAEGAIKIVLDPGVVFGTSLHPTTRDCLLALLKVYEEYQFNSVLDLGTGTGILAIAAALLGADTVLAVDINPLAVRTALQNIRLNGLEERVEVTKGLAEDFIGCNADLLIANIHHDTILKLTNAQGFLEKKCFILSGLMWSQAREIRLHLSKYPIEIDHEWSQDMVWHTILGRVKDS